VKRFQIVTEADARVLEYGSSIVVSRGGHVTPLAADTLRERRIAVLHESHAGADADRAPVARPRTVVLAGDHSAVALKAALVAHLRGLGVTATDAGTATSDPVDYPDTASAAARLVARGEADAAVVIDGAGLGSAMAANKVPGARAAMCTTQTLARYAREHNGANVLCLGASLVSVEEAVAIVDTFLATPMTEPRYIRRLAKLHALDMAPRQP
jgi:ribose 5-phosphate isomerase B